MTVRIEANRSDTNRRLRHLTLLLAVRPLGNIDEDGIPLGQGGSKTDGHDGDRLSNFHGRIGMLTEGMMPQPRLFD